MPIITYSEHANFFQIAHPLIQHKLSLLRDYRISKREFKELLHEITILLAYEVTKELPLTEKQIQTPLEEFRAPVLAGKKPVVLPILRAGIGMVDGFLTLMPSARVGHIGIFRNEKTLKPTVYFFKIPTQSKDRQFYILDPMLATGGSASEAINHLKKQRIKKITLVCLVAAPEGIKYLYKKHPDIYIYAASLDRKLNQKGYILPGLGDAGDRLFGTK